MISTREKLDTYWGLSGCYIGLIDVENAVNILNQEKEILEQLAGAKPANYPLYRDRLLDNELRFCQIYAKVREIPKLKSHLLMAKKHYTEDVFLPYYFSTISLGPIIIIWFKTGMLVLQNWTWYWNVVKVCNPGMNGMSGRQKHNTCGMPEGKKRLWIPMKRLFR